MGFRPKVYITRQIPQKGLERLLKKCNVSYWDSPDPAPRTEILFNVRGVDVLVCMPTDNINEEVLDTAGPTLKVVATMSEDTEHIDTDACRDRNIRVIQLNQVPAQIVADLTIGLLILTTMQWLNGERCNINVILQQTNIMSIKRIQSYCVEMSNRTLGILGMGPVGMKVANMLQEIGVADILYHDTGPNPEVDAEQARFVSFEELINKSDIICMCSNDKKSSFSSRLFTADTFKKMKNSAILIDATKGPAIDYNDLYDALRSGEISGAGLDVREYDVIPNRHPLQGLENCHFLPFRECYKWDGRSKISDELAKSVLNSVDIEC